LEKVPARRRWWPVLLPLVLLAIGLSVITPAGRHQWELSLFKQPTDYTVLSFNRAWALPAEAVAGRPIAISFSVANHQGRAERYRYVLEQEAAGRSLQLQQSSRVVQSGATWTVSTTVRPTCPTSPCKVQVSLPGHPETIDFLLAITGNGPPSDTSAAAASSRRIRSSRPRRAR
jgi:hypothetical protein